MLAELHRTRTFEFMVGMNGDVAQLYGRCSLVPTHPREWRRALPHDLPKNLHEAACVRTARLMAVRGDELLHQRRKSEVPPRCT